MSIPFQKHAHLAVSLAAIASLSAVSNAQENTTRIILDADHGQCIMENAHRLDTLPAPATIEFGNCPNFDKTTEKSSNSVYVDKPIIIDGEDGISFAVSHMFGTAEEIKCFASQK